MDKNNIAILTDSCSDVPRDLLERFHIYQIPLLINYRNKSYRDRIDITPQEVYENLQYEIPHTSLPSRGEIHEIIEQIIADGYDQIIIPIISSRLSGTYNAISAACEDFDNIKTAVIDTKNIALGSGFFSIYAAGLVEQHLNFEEIAKKTEDKIRKSHIYYSLKTLHYLIKGGRLGRVEGMLGNILSLKPIITCDEEGVYYTVQKVRGRKQSINKVMEIVKDQIKDKKNYYLAICHGNATEEAEEVKREMQPYIDKATLFMEGQISPALGVHTGPGLIGVGFFDLDD
jgi:DegV family protein with EDD domain